MPYIPDQNDQEQQQGQNTQMNQLPSTAGGGPQGATAVPNATKAPPVQDLRAYLAANAPQAAQMGQKIAGNIADETGRVTGDVNAAQAGVQSQINAQTVTPNADLVSRAAANPSEFVKNPEDVAAFRAQRDAAYNGPQYFEQTPEFSTANAAVRARVNALPDVDKPGGIEQLVRSQEKNPTLGMENLDTLLLQGTPSAVQPIRESISGGRALDDYLKGITGTENAAIQDAKAKNDAARAAVQQTFVNGPNAVVPSLDKSISDRVAASQKQSADANIALQKLYAGDTLTPAELELLGMDSGALNQIVSAEQYLKPYGVDQDILPTFQTGAKGPAEFTAANVATPEEYANYAALAELLGPSAGTLLKPENAGMAGTAPGATAFDYEAALAKLLAEEQRFGGLTQPGPGSTVIGPVYGAL